MALVEKNLWVAAGDGDLERVKELINQSISPNIPDPNTYTPMHAAASYGQIEVLAYLVANGGDVNITDEDGDTPLYTVENIETARWLVDHGAVVDRRNNEGISPIEHLSEDFAAVASFLETTSTASISAPRSQQPSQHSQHVASEQLTSALMASVQEIMQRAEVENRDPEEELRQAVSRTVLEGVVTGFEMSTEEEDIRSRVTNDTPSKRMRTDHGTG